MITTVTLNTAIDKLYIIDSLLPYEVMRVNNVNNTAGGKGLNVSRVAALAGEQVISTGFAGGYNGQLFESLITEPNITTAFTHIQGETRCCINVRDTAANRSTEFLEPGCSISKLELEQFTKDYIKSIQDSSVVTISGSMPKGIPVDFYKTLITIAKDCGKYVILDTSGQTLKEAIKAKPTMIKPNTDEIRQLLDINIDSLEQLIDAAQHLHDSGIAIVVVSLGKKGALVVCEEGIYEGITPDIPVVNTVGCGDSMVAGFAVGLSRGYTMEETIRFAVAISTANALTMETGSFRQKDLDWLLTQVEVRKLTDRKKAI
ncbi:1-phosphofructokinase [Hydrogenoanaerobacterium sp.]|uniref:1-phosphofructokinase n=1 Tax=Hydrogenoanaerobacterium sp. TaxID=2953763 RepID=UPI00289A0101|nr:1-phosphofructokinase [Hydrogenoanaerobacterium sp.]